MMSCGACDSGRLKSENVPTIAAKPSNKSNSNSGNPRIKPIANPAHRPKAQAPVQGALLSIFQR